MEKKIDHDITAYSQVACYYIRLPAYYGRLKEGCQNSGEKLGLAIYGGIFFVGRLGRDVWAGLNGVQRRRHL